MDKAKIDRINYLARKSRERELTTEEKEEQLELRNEYRASFKRGLMSELDRVYVVDDKGKETGGIVQVKQQNGSIKVYEYDVDIEGNKFIKSVTTSELDYFADYE